MYTESRVYTIKTTTVNGCDSFATLDLTINKASATIVELSDCESISFNGDIIDENGTYYYNFQSAQGCDSRIILIASILAENEQLEMTSCDTYT